MNSGSEVICVCMWGEGRKSWWKCEIVCSAGLVSVNADSEVVGGRGGGGGGEGGLGGSVK